MYAIGNLNLYLRQNDPTHLDKFLKQIEWLENNAQVRDDGAAVWPHNFDLRDGAVHHKGPWLSSNVQGLIISALVRGWRSRGGRACLNCFVDPPGSLNSTNAMAVCGPAEKGTSFTPRRRDFPRRASWMASSDP